MEQGERDKREKIVSDTQCTQWHTYTQAEKGGLLFRKDLCVLQFARKDWEVGKDQVGREGKGASERCEQRKGQGTRVQRVRVLSVFTGRCVMCVMYAMYAMYVVDCAVYARYFFFLFGSDFFWQVQVAGGRWQGAGGAVAGGEMKVHSD
jgi:hypothetical protein